MQRVFYDNSSSSASLYAYNTVHIHSFLLTLYIHIYIDHGALNGIKGVADVCTIQCNHDIKGISFIRTSINNSLLVHHRTNLQRTTININRRNSSINLSSNNNTNQTLRTNNNIKHNNRTIVNLVRV